MRRHSRIKARVLGLQSKIVVETRLMALSKWRAIVRWNQRAKQCIRVLKGRIASHSSLDAFAAWRAVAWRRKISGNKVRAPRLVTLHLAAQN